MGGFLSCNDLDVRVVDSGNSKTGEEGLANVAESSGIESVFKVLQGEGILQDIVVIKEGSSLVEDGLVESRNVSEVIGRDDGCQGTKLCAVGGEESSSKSSDE